MPKDSIREIYSSVHQKDLEGRLQTAFAADKQTFYFGSGLIIICLYILFYISTKEHINDIVKIIGCLLFIPIGYSLDSCYYNIRVYYISMDIYDVKIEIFHKNVLEGDNSTINELTSKIDFLIDRADKYFKKSLKRLKISIILCFLMLSILYFFNNIII